MACGICLGILLICFIQVERVSCLRTSRGESLRRQNDDGYVGFPQQESRLRRLDSSYPQNQFRQASFSPRSSYSGSLKQAPASSACSRGLFSGGNTQTAQRPVQKVQTSRLFSKPSQQAASKEVKPPAAPKKKFQLSTAVVAGSSVSQASQKKNNKPTSKVQKRPQSVQGASLGAQPPFSRREGYSFKLAQGPALEPYNRPKGTSAQSSSPAKTQTSVSSRGRKVTLEYRPAGSSSSSSRLGHSWSKPKYQRPSQSAKPGYASLLKSPSRKNPTGGSRYRSEPSTGSGGSRFAPTDTFNIPDRFGGVAIRRLSSPSKPKPAAGKIWQPTPATRPPGVPPPKQYVSRIEGDAKWMRAKLV